MDEQAHRMIQRKPLFEFIQYIQPAWYFNLMNSNQILWVDYFKLPPADQALINWDENYSSKSASILDAAFQALQKGIIPERQNAHRSMESIKPSIDDNYRFIRKYYHPFWMLYILLMRLVSLYKPLRELHAFLRALSVKRMDLFHPSKAHPEFLTFSSTLEQSRPLVSIVIPTLNRYNYLKRVLCDLENQTYNNFEVIIADQSEPYDKSFYQGWNLNLDIIRQTEKALWLARNQCIKKASGDYILLFDDDSRVEDDWVRQHLRCLDYFQADVSSGVSRSLSGSRVPRNYRFFRLSDQVDTGNAMVRKGVYRQTGLFDRQFENQRMGDAEFGLRCHLLGFKNISNPHAGRLHLKVQQGGLRQMGSWDAFRPRGLFSPRPIPSVLYYIRKYHGKQAAKWSLLQNIPPSLLPYRFKKYRSIYFAGFILAILLFPLVIFQIRKSWKISSRMLTQGALISQFNGHEKSIGHIL